MQVTKANPSSFMGHLRLFQLPGRLLPMGRQGKEFVGGCGLNPGG
jgi:hypothetical protein